MTNPTWVVFFMCLLCALWLRHVWRELPKDVHLMRCGRCFLFACLCCSLSLFAFPAHPLPKFPKQTVSPLPVQVLSLLQLTTESARLLFSQHFKLYRKYRICGNTEGCFRGHACGPSWIINSRGSQPVSPSPLLSAFGLITFI